jgi:hypothetical protein
MPCVHASLWKVDHSTTMVSGWRSSWLKFRRLLLSWAWTVMHVSRIVTAKVAWHGGMHWWGYWVSIMQFRWGKSKSVSGIYYSWRSSIPVVGK